MTDSKRPAELDDAQRQGTSIRREPDGTVRYWRGYQWCAQCGGLPPVLVVRDADGTVFCPACAGGVIRTLDAAVVRLTQRTAVADRLAVVLGMLVGFSLTAFGVLLALRWPR